jgi:sec-independent protein translocase protein TatC
MSSEQRRLTERVANQPSEDLTEQDQAAVVAMLNSLADNPKVHEAGDFRQSSAAKEKNASAIYEQLEQDKQAGEALDADQSRRLNKQLITSIYPGVLRAPRVVLVDVTTWKPTEVRIQSLGAHEAFMIWIKAAFVSGLVMASPWIFLQIWTFVGAGLYPHEKGYVYVYLPFSLMLFLAGASLAFFFVFEPVLQFLLSFNKAMDIDPDPRISEWISFVLLMPLGFGASFQLPLVMLFLNRIGIFSLDAYLEKWRIAVLVIFIISMFLTPADPISMLLMAVPLTILYFGGVALCRWMPRGRNPFADAYEP